MREARRTDPRRHTPLGVDEPASPALPQVPRPARRQDLPVDRRLERPPAAPPDRRVARECGPAQRRDDAASPAVGRGALARERGAGGEGGAPHRLPTVRRARRRHRGASRHGLRLERLPGRQRRRLLPVGPGRAGHRQLRLPSGAGRGRGAARRDRGDHPRGRRRAPRALLRCRGRAPGREEGPRVSGPLPRSRSPAPSDRPRLRGRGRRRPHARDPPRGRPLRRPDHGQRADRLDPGPDPREEPPAPLTGQPRGGRLRLPALHLHPRRHPPAGPRRHPQLPRRRGPGEDRGRGQDARRGPEPPGGRAATPAAEGPAGGAGALRGDCRGPGRGRRRASPRPVRAGVRPLGRGWRRTRGGRVLALRARHEGAAGGASSCREVAGGAPVPAAGGVVPDPGPRPLARHLAPGAGREPLRSHQAVPGHRLRLGRVVEPAVRVLLGRLDAAPDDHEHPAGHPPAGARRGSPDLRLLPVDAGEGSDLGLQLHRARDAVLREADDDRGGAARPGADRQGVGAPHGRHHDGADAAGRRPSRPAPAASLRRTPPDRALLPPDELPSAARRQGDTDRRVGRRAGAGLPDGRTGRPGPRHRLRLPAGLPAVEPTGALRDDRQRAVGARVTAHARTRDRQRRQDLRARQGLRAGEAAGPEEVHSGAVRDRREPDHGRGGDRHGPPEPDAAGRADGRAGRAPEEADRLRAVR